MFTLTEAAKRLGISKSLVARYVRNRRLRAIPLGGRPFIRTTELTRFGREREKKRRNGSGKTGVVRDRRITPLPSPRRPA